jgi:hypothetical protein
VRERAAVLMLQSVVAVLWQRWAAVLMLQSVVAELWQRWVAVLWQREAEMLMLWKEVEWLYLSCPPRGDWCRRSPRQQCSRDILPLSAVSCKHACTYTYIYVEILFIMHALALKSILNNFPYIFTYFTIEDKAYNRNKL